MGVNLMQNGYAFGELARQKTDELMREAEQERKVRAIQASSNSEWGKVVARILSAVGARLFGRAVLALLALRGRGGSYGADTGEMPGLQPGAGGGSAPVSGVRNLN